MGDHISSEDRALINAAIDAGQITRVPTGASVTSIEYVWESRGPDSGSLIAVDPDKRGLWRGFHCAAGRGAVGPSPAINARRARVRQMVADQKTVDEISAALDRSRKVIAGDIAAMGLERPQTARQKYKAEVVAARRVKVAEMIADGMTSVAIAKLLGVSYRTIQCDRRALREQSS
ncbi:MAG TPA: hypothetical protein ENK28_04930 [Aliiroseovarius sp.]|nr:hypothetical protein [Aliiroseovarius sp.]